MKSRVLCNLLAIVCLSVSARANSGSSFHSNSSYHSKEKKPASKKVSATHPFYRSALADLRTARWMIYHHPVNWQPTVSEKAAIGHIDAAISAIVKASINDGRGPGDRPKGAPRKDVPTRLNMALSYLKKARINISRDGDKNLAEGLQLRAYEQIDGAIGQVRTTLRS